MTTNIDNKILINSTNMNTRNKYTTDVNNEIVAEGNHQIITEIARLHDTMIEGFKNMDKQLSNLLNN